MVKRFYFILVGVLGILHSSNALVPIVCRIQDIAIELVKAGDPNVVTDKAQDCNTNDERNIAKAHTGGPMLLVDHFQTSMSCVDGRSSRPLFGTPGGDYSEFVTAMFSASQICDQFSVTRQDFLQLMAEFIDEFATESRPFYMHTDRRHMQHVFDRMKVNEWPKQVPPNMNEWLQVLTSDPEMHGCGHVRYMFMEHEKYGVPQELSQAALFAYFNLLWHPKFASRMLYDVVDGDMKARGVMILDKEQSVSDKNGVCANKGLMMIPRLPDTMSSQLIGSNGDRPADMFIYHASAAKSFEENVTAPFMAKYCKIQGKTKDQVLKLLQQRIYKNAQKHMTVTVDKLAKGLPVYKVQTLMTSTHRIA